MHASLRDMRTQVGNAWQSAVSANPSRITFSERSDGNVIDCKTFLACIPVEICPHTHSQRRVCLQRHIAAPDAKAFFLIGPAALLRATCANSSHNPAYIAVYRHVRVLVVPEYGETYHGITTVECSLV